MAERSEVQASGAAVGALSGSPAVAGTRVVPLLGALYEQAEQAVGAAVREIEEATPPLYVARIGEYAYTLVPASRLDELPAHTPLVARIQGTATARAEAEHTTAGRRLAEIEAVLQVVLGPRPVRRRRGDGALPQPITADDAHGYAERFGGA